MAEVEGEREAAQVRPRSTPACVGVCFAVSDAPAAHRAAPKVPQCVPPPERAAVPCAQSLTAADERTHLSLQLQ